MKVFLNREREQETLRSLSLLSPQAKDTVTMIFEVLEAAASMVEVEAILLSDLQIAENAFTITVRENFQFVVAGVLGEIEGDDAVIIEVVRYE